MIKLVFLLSVLFLTACLNPKYITDKKEYAGVIAACKADSNIIKSDTLIKIKTAYRLTKKTWINWKYLNCDDRPAYVDAVVQWPGFFTFNFKKKNYYFLHNSRINSEYTRDGKKNYAVAYDLDYGSIKLNKTEKTLVLSSSKYNITRVFLYTYSKQDSLLTLRSKL